MVLSAANQALFLARDWRYSIESITYHREALVIRKKADAPRLDEAQIGGGRPLRGALARGAGRRGGKEIGTRSISHKPIRWDIIRCAVLC